MSSGDNVIMPGMNDSTWKGDPRAHRRSTAPRRIAVLALVALAASTFAVVHAEEAPSRPFAFVANRHPHSVAIDWVEAMLLAIESNPPSPTATTWRMWVIATSMFDAYAAYDQTAVGVASGDAKRPVAEHTDDHRDTAVAYAAHHALTYAFPGQRDVFDAVLAFQGGDPDGNPIAGSAAAVGHAAAAAAIELREHDGSNVTGGFQQVVSDRYPTFYQSVNSADPTAPNSRGGPSHDPNRWTPLRVPTGSAPVEPHDRTTYLDQEFLTPHWGDVDGFALRSGDQFRPPPPPSLLDDSPYLDALGVASTGDAAFRSQTAEVLAHSGALTDERKVIAEFWADGPHTWTPPGHWVQIAIGVSLRDQHTLGEDVAMYLALTSAVLDAGIASWDAKRHYDYVRPATAIPYLYAGESVTAWRGPGLGSGKIDGGDWQPYQSPTFVTPPFAEYVSGHSTFSRSAAEVLTAFAGSATMYDGVTLLGRDHDGDGVEDLLGRHVAPAGSLVFDDGPAAPVELTWPTFRDAADQAGISRLYGGIHFQDGDLQGREMGRQVGQQVWHVVQLHIDPASTLTTRITELVAAGDVAPRQGEHWTRFVDRAFDAIRTDQPAAACAQLGTLARISHPEAIVEDVRRVVDHLCRDSRK